MSQKNLEDLFLQQAADLFWMIDNDMNLVYANQAYLNLMKQVSGKEKKLKEKVFVEGFGEGYIEKWTDYYKKALTGHQFEIEEHYSHPLTNEIQYGQIIFNPIRDEKSTIVAVACQSRDITRVVKQRSEAHQLMDASLDVFCTINEEGNFVFVSEAATQHWGYRPQELIGKPYESFIIEEDIPKTNNIADAILSGEEIKSFVNRYKRKDGDIAYNLWSARWDTSAKLMYCVARDAKEKIEQETLLLQSEQRFRDLVQEGSDLIAILDVDGTYRYVSPTSTTILGIRPEEFLGRSPFEFIHPDDVEQTMASLQKITEHQKVQVEPFRFKNDKGEWRWIETVLTNMLDNPAVNGIVANSKDITEKIKILKNIEENEQFNKTIIESSPDCLKILDDEGRLLYMNFNGLCQMEIDDFSKFKNKQWWNLWGTENEALVKESVKKALAGETAEFTAFCPTAKGTPKWWDVTVAPVIVSSNEPIQKIISISRDITKKKQEEQQLKLLSSVITNTNDAVLITEAEPLDEPGPRILYVNEAFTKMTGYTAEEVIGKTPRILQGPKSDKAELARLSKALRNWESCEITTVNYKKNGEEFWINFSVVPVADETGWYTHWCAIERDVTQQKHQQIVQELTEGISIAFNEQKEIHSALHQVVSSVADLDKFCFCEIWLTNINNSALSLTAYAKKDTAAEIFYNEFDLSLQLKKGESVAGTIWQNNDTFVWDREVDSKPNLIRKNALDKAGINSIIGVPLYHQNKLVGALLVGSQQSYRHTKWVLNVLQGLEQLLGGEIARKKMEVQLAKVFDFSPDIIMVAGFDGYIKTVNPSGSRILEYTADELLSKPFMEFIHPDDHPKAKAHLGILLEGQPIYNIELRYISKSGAIKTLSWNASPSLEEGLIYGVSKDITSEIKMADLLKDASHLSRIGSWEVDLVNNNIYWSDVTYEIHEALPSFQPDLATAITFYREDFRDMVTAAVAKCINEGTAFDFEAVIVTAQKNEVWVRSIGRGEIINNKCIRLYGSFQDISEVKETQYRLQSLSNNLPGVVFQYYRYPDGRDELKNVSSGAQQIWGFTAEEAMRDNQQIWKQLEKGGDMDAHKKSIDISIETKTLWKHKWKYVMPNNEIKTHLGYGTPAFLADGTVVFNSVILDVTKETKTEQLLSDASKMARIGSWELDLLNEDGDRMYWSPIVFDILEIDENYNPSLSGGLEMHVEESRIRIQNRMQQLIEAGTEFDEELLLITGKGNERWVRCIGKREMINNKPSKIYGSFQDIDAVKKSAQALEVSYKERTQILESIGDAFFAVDKDWIVTYWNKEAEQVLGKKREDIVGCHLWTEYADVKDTDFYREYHRAMETQQNVTFEEYYATLDKWFEVSAYPSPNSLSVYFKDVTLRKAADSRLINANNEKTRILERITEAFVSLDNNWCYTYMNKQAGIIFNRDPEKMIGKHIWTEFPEGLNQPFHLAYEKAMATQEYIYIEEHYKPYDLWFENHIYPSPDGISIFFRDVTDRKRNEEKLKIANERFELVTRTTTDAIWDWDIINDNFYRGEGFEKLFGYTVKRNLNEVDFWNDTFHPEDLPKIKASLEVALKNIAVHEWQMEYRIILPEGFVKTVVDKGVIIRDEHGKPQRMIGAITDISFKKEAEQAILAAKDRFEKVAEATNDAIWDWNIVENTLFWGEGFKKLFGYDIDKVTPTLQSWTDYVHPDDLSDAMASLEAAIENSEITHWSHEYRFQKTDKTYAFVIDKGVVIRDENRRAVRMVGAMADISERKLYEEQLLSINKKLESQTKELLRSNEELEQFAFITSHDLQEPLRMISSFMDQLMRKYGSTLDKKAQQYIEFAMDGAKRMKQIILDLLLYSRASKPSEQLEVVNFNEIVSEFLQLRRKLIAEKKAVINCKDLPVMETYKAPITQVFHCLLDNALKYTKENVPPVVEIKVKEKEEYWEFAIKDNGIGIDELFFEKIFIIFQRLHNRNDFGGTGIGLSITKRSIEFLGGKIWLKSKVGEGAIFYFTLPKKQLNNL